SPARAGRTLLKKVPTSSALSAGANRGRLGGANWSCHLHARRTFARASSTSAGASVHQRQWRSAFQTCPRSTPRTARYAKTALTARPIQTSPARARGRKVTESARRSFSLVRISAVRSASGGGWTNFPTQGGDVDRAGAVRAQSVLERRISSAA